MGSNNFNFTGKIPFIKLFSTNLFHQWIIYLRLIYTLLNCLNFHLYLATFKHNMNYIGAILQTLGFLSQCRGQRVTAKKETMEARVPSCSVITSKDLRSPNTLWLTVNCTNDNKQFLFVVNTTQIFPHSWLITGFVSKEAKRVPLEEHEIRTFRTCVFSGGLHVLGV